MPDPIGHSEIRIRVEQWPHEKRGRLAPRFRWGDVDIRLYVLALVSHPPCSPTAAQVVRLVAAHGMALVHPAGDVEKPQERVTMPYRTIEELPESVREHLPEHAQEIYRAAFNSAWEEYGHDEARAHRIAWGAVKREYHKDQKGQWVRSEK